MEAADFKEITFICWENDVFAHSVRLFLCILLCVFYCENGGGGFADWTTNKETTLILSVWSNVPIGQCWGLMGWLQLGHLATISFSLLLFFFFASYFLLHFVCVHVCVCVFYSAHFLKLPWHYESWHFQTLNDWPWPDWHFKYRYSTSNYVTLMLLQPHISSQAVQAHAGFITVESLCKPLSLFFLLNTAVISPLRFLTHISSALFYLPLSLEQRVCKK